MLTLMKYSTRYVTTADRMTLPELKYSPFKILESICFYVFKMTNVIPNLEQFFDLFLRCVCEGIAGLSSEYGPNRVESLLSRLGEFERTLGLISSRLGEHRSSDQLLEDIEQLLTAVRLLQARYQHRYANSCSEASEGPGEGALLYQCSCPLEYTGQACRPRLAVDKAVVQRVRSESLKWVDIARILGISSKTLVRRRKEFEMPIGADAFTRIEDSDLDEHVRAILGQNPEAGIL